MIRRATLADLPELMEMARDMHRTTEFSAFSLHVDKLERYLRGVLQDAFVVLSPGRGFFAGDVGPLWFSEELCAWDRILYVYPQHRGKMLGVRFISLFEAWAKDQGARAVIIAVSSGVDVARTGKLFEHRGYSCLGGVYRKECI
jgi:GNAT superfamily N-acetyltransferase